MDHTTPVAVVGLAAYTPGAADVTGFWRNVLTGRDLMGDVPASHWLIDDFYSPDRDATDKTYARRGAFLDPVDFDPMAFGVPPNSVQATDTTQLLALMVTDAVLKDCSGLSELDRERVSVILGSAPLELLYNMASRLQRPVWLKSLREAGVGERKAQEICDRISDHYVPWQEASFPGLLSNVVAGRVANRFDLHGTNYTVDAACASSLAAISSAVKELALGTSDLVITGGVDTLNDILMYMCFSKTPALSPSGDCRPFSDAADGTMLGEGLVMFALKRLDDAERDGDRVYAVIRGIGSSSDGKGTAIYAPAPAGQARALRRAYEAAGYGPDTVELVEAHGTGTTAGDAAEFAALREVFAESGRPDAQWCALGTVKSQIGHTKAAAGAAGLLKAVLALHHKVLPPTIKVERPNPELELETSPLYLNTRARPWVRGAEHPRRASVSSFGFGGSNFHLTLEEYTGPAQAYRARALPSELVLLSASSVDELVASARSLRGSLSGIARRTQLSFDVSRAERLAIVAVDLDDFRSKVDQFDRYRKSLPGVHHASGAADAGEIAFLFPGQGSQYVGMGADIAMHFPRAGAVWDQRADLGPHRTAFPVPVFSDEERSAQEQRLTATECAQPALAVTSLALLEVLDTLGVRASCAAGHSFGELVALCYSGALSPADLVALARRRGELMRDAAESPGVMLAVTASRKDVSAALSGCADWWIANHNTPAQVIVSVTGSAAAAVEQALSRFTVKRLNTATAFHSPVVASAHEPLLEFLRTLSVQAPSIPVYGNAGADLYPADADEIRARVAAHLQLPVRFVDEITAMYDAGVRTFVEIGAGSVTSRMVAEILGSSPHLAVSLDRKGRDGVTSLHDALGQLAVAGVAMDFAALWADYAPEAEPQDEKPRMTMPISGANHDRPYPPRGGAAALPDPNPDDVLHPPAQSFPAAAVPAAPAADGWLAAYQAMQQQTADIHAGYQKTMAENHLAFLRATEASLRALSGDLPAVPPVADQIPTVFPEPVVQPPVGGPIPPSAFAEPPLPLPVPRPVPTAEMTPDLQGALLAVVAEKTGYPVGMLNAGMELESDLGIDSIKRVEILSALKERVPGLPEVDVAELGKLRTLGEIADVVGGGGGSADSDHSAPDLRGALLAVVAEKTGYPVAMLDAGMELESDLGIDSIKRVEILSALKERVPGLPEVNVAELGKLRTLGQIGEALTGSESTVDVPVELTRLAVRMTPEPASGLMMAGLGQGELVVTDDGAGVAEEVAAQLTAHGCPARVVHEVPADAYGVVFLGGLRDVHAEDEAIEVNREAFRAARAVAARFGTEPGVFVTVQDTGGDFGLRGSTPRRCWLGGIAGLTRTAALEWPEVSVKAIDCERGDRAPAEIAAAIVRELLDGGDTVEVGLRAFGLRSTVGTVATRAESAPRINADSVIVATGGARGVTAAALLALAEQHQPKLVLLGRTGLTDEPATSRAITEETQLKRAVIDEMQRATGKAPSPAEVGAEVKRRLAVREIRRTLKALEAAGSKAQYISVDVTDPHAVDQALDEVRFDWGPITGVVHGAGVLADKRIADKTDDQFRRVFDTKVAGLRALLRATLDDPITVLCLFSSVAARYGNVGQSDYAMANEVLNQVACAAQASDPDLAVHSIDWGAWEGGMVTPALAEHFRNAGVGLIPLNAGARAFVDEITGARGDVHVVIAPDGTETLSGKKKPRTAQVVVSERTHPELADHRIAGTPVLPMALALEWFTAMLPDGPVSLGEVAVLRKISLDAETRLLVRADENGLRLIGDAVHYQARIGEIGTPAEWAPPLTGESQDVRYDGDPLFHGPRFQAITELRQVTDTTAEALVRGVRGLAWTGQWRTDPAAVDACLQLALLWGKRVLDGATLPMGAREFRLHRPGPLEDTARCVLRAAGVHGDRAECDVALIDSDSGVRAELLGVSLVRRPR